MSRPEKKQRTEDYILYYWPEIPGRGEYVRLALEYGGVPYTEQTNPQTLLPTLTSAAHIGAPPHFAPPALQLPSGRVLSQTPAILHHIAPRCGLAGPRGNTLDDGWVERLARAEEERSVVNQLTLTALDWSDEAHDVHHPVASELYYEDQKAEAARRAENFRRARVPKFLAYFENVLTSNPDTQPGETGKKGEKGGKGETGAGAGGRTYLHGKQTTMADVVLFHVLDGLLFAFPRRLAQLREGGKYKHVFALHERVKGEKGIKEYVASGRRQPFSLGLFRHYEELDGEDEEQ
ncbi:glutathione S-transferase C-terminal-like protein [Fomes fomentarius]|nr:glutathione S-transferase C-terminal-like protein [Fomes fomentarius]